MNDGQIDWARVRELTSSIKALAVTLDKAAVVQAIITDISDLITDIADDCGKLEELIEPFLPDTV